MLGVAPPARLARRRRAARSLRGVSRVRAAVTGLCRAWRGGEGEWVREWRGDFSRRKNDCSQPRECLFRGFQTPGLPLPHVRAAGNAPPPVLPACNKCDECSRVGEWVCGERAHTSCRSPPPTLPPEEAEPSVVVWSAGSSHTLGSVVVAAARTHAVMMARVMVWSEVAMGWGTGCCSGTRWGKGGGGWVMTLQSTRNKKRLSGQMKAAAHAWATLADTPHTHAHTHAPKRKAMVPASVTPGQPPTHLE
jgi:hypothetical protein